MFHVEMPGYNLQAPPPIPEVTLPQSRNPFGRNTTKTICDVEASDVVRCTQHIYTEEGAESHVTDATFVDGMVRGR